MQCIFNFLSGGVAELVDALDLGSSAARCKSSSLFAPTIYIKLYTFIYLNMVAKGLNPKYLSLFYCLYIGFYTYIQQQRIGTTIRTIFYN